MHIHIALGLRLEIRQIKNKYGWDMMKIPTDMYRYVSDLHLL
jgi:hypothetical protein